MLDTVAEFPVRNAGQSRSENLAAALLARSETGLIALDSCLRVVLANQAALSYLGVPTSAEQEPLAALLERGVRLTGPAGAALLTWLESDGGREHLVPLDERHTLAVERAPGPHDHLLLSLRMESCAMVPASRRDPLTGLADRSWFLERLGAMLADPAAKPAVLMIDLDRFKAVNDSLGHPVGDALLQLVAKRLRNALRAADLICRFAGDEFAVLVSCAGDPGSIARRLVTLLSRPYLIEGATVSVGASVGVALGPEHGADTATLIRAADVALYAAKGDGRGGSRVFDAGLDQTARERHALAEALRKAIPLRQLEVHFQPHVMLDGGKLTGFEAFVRWNHPEFGLLLPERFITLAEQTRLIWPIGEWVLRRACEEAITWPKHLSVAVNISAKQLLDRHRLPRMIKSMLLKTGLAPHRLEIEVTEHALMQEIDTLPVLTAIRALGVRISLDDFGTGYSSLSHLHRFPLNKLKIDRSFVHALGSSDEARNVVRAIAALGTTLGITTLAEGVETADQQNRVRLDGCTEIQGFYLSKPVPASEVGRVIASLSPSAQAAGQAS